MATGPIRQIVRHLRRASSLRDTAELSDGQLLERFLACRDEAAFEALLRRHGPMVLGVCRRVLGNAADAEDAFQATFLVLVRKARSIRPRELVGHWLHGVAYRTALRARSAAAQRRVKESQVWQMPRPETTPDETWRDLRPLLDRELNGLPEKYRVAIVLCDLEGKTRREAARQLGWPEGTLSCRLARGRALLARRLARHGLNLSGAAVALALAQEAVAAIPSDLLTTTARGLLAGAAALPAGVAALAEGVLKAMLLTRLKIGAALVLAVGLVVAGTGVLRGRAAEGTEDVSARPAAAPPVVGKAPRKPHAVQGNDDLKEWVLDFRFRDPRLIWVEMAGKGWVRFWYLPYDVTNRTPVARTFIPSFELLLPGQAAGRPDEVNPRVEAAIQRQEDPNGLLKLQNSVTISHAPIPPPPPGGPPHTVHGLAIWADLPGEAKEFTIFVSGLTNVFQTEEVPGTQLTRYTAVRRKVLLLHFRREGQEMRFLPPAEWVFRKSQIRLAPPPQEKQKEQEKKRVEEQHRYLKALMEATRAFEKERVGQHQYLKAMMDAAHAFEQPRAPQKDVAKKVIRQIDDALRQLRQQTGDEQAELDALDEIERGLKDLRRQRADHRNELEKLQGLWLPKKLEIGGSAVPLEIVPSLSPPSAVAILGDRFLTRAGKAPQQVPTIRLHPRSKPAGIDLHVGGKVIRATYELQGDTLRIRVGDSTLTYQRKKL